MSRRRGSEREPGVPGPGGAQGWLRRRQTGTVCLLGPRWRRTWFVLRNGSLSWYPSHTAKDAEGFVDLTDVTIQPIRSQWKQHVFTVCRRDAALVVMAAESFTEMSLWTDKLWAAALQTKAPLRRRECYCPTSDESEESVFYSRSPCTELPTMDSLNGEFPPPCFTSSPFNHVLTSHRPSRTSTSSTGGTGSSENSQSGSWLDLPTPDAARSAAEPPAFLLGAGDDEEPFHFLTPESRPEDTETSSSPVGRTKPSNQRHRRGLLVRLQENLYLARILNPPLKTEEEEGLLAFEEVLTDPARPPLNVCNWRHKFILLQEFTRCQRPAGGAAWIPAAKERRVAETSV